MPTVRQLCPRVRHTCESCVAATPPHDRAWARPRLRRRAAETADIGERVDFESKIKGNYRSEVSKSNPF